MVYRVTDKKPYEFPGNTKQEIKNTMDDIICSQITKINELAYLRQCIPTLLQNHNTEVLLDNLIESMKALTDEFILIRKELE